MDFVRSFFLKIRYKYYRFKRWILLILYYGFAIHLPVSHHWWWGFYWSKYVRFFICCRLFRYVGKGINVERGAVFGTGEEIEIGDFSGLGVGCRVPGNVKIGSNVMMGPKVVVLGQNHRYDRVDIPMQMQGNIKARRVVIGDDVWLGTCVIILPGIEIGQGAVIGAGSVVTKDIPPYSVCAGNPARLIRYRIKQ